MKRAPQQHGVSQVSGSWGGGVFLYSELRQGFFGFFWRTLNPKSYGSGLRVAFLPGPSSAACSVALFLF